MDVLKSDLRSMEYLDERVSPGILTGDIQASVTATEISLITPLPGSRLQQLLSNGDIHLKRYGHPMEKSFVQGTHSGT